MVGGNHSCNVNADMMFRQKMAEKRRGTHQVDPFRPPLIPFDPPMGVDSTTTRTRLAASFIAGIVRRKHHLRRPEAASCSLSPIATDLPARRPARSRDKAPAKPERAAFVSRRRRLPAACSGTSRANGRRKSSVDTSAGSPHRRSRAGKIPPRRNSDCGRTPATAGGCRPRAQAAD